MSFDAFYSDPHFGHTNIIKFCERPYRNIDEMHHDFIQRYNARIKAKQDVLYCGDVFFKCSIAQAKQIFDALNGNKYLIEGNHDPSVSKMLAIGFQWVTTELRINVDGYNCRVSHYPYALTDNEKRKLITEGKYVDERYLDRRPIRRKGETLIHGHTHSTKRYHNNMVHVGVDAWNYGPAMMGEVIALLDKASQ